MEPDMSRYRGKMTPRLRREYPGLKRLRFLDRFRRLWHTGFTIGVVKLLVLLGIVAIIVIAALSS